MMDRTERMSGQTNDTKKTASSVGLSGKPSGISDQIELLRSDLSGLAEQVTGLTKEKIGEKIGEVQDAAANKADELQASIRAKPMQSAAIAAGVGFVLGLLLTR